MYDVVGSDLLERYLNALQHKRGPVSEFEHRFIRRILDYVVKRNDNDKGNRFLAFTYNSLKYSDRTKSEEAVFVVLKTMRHDVGLSTGFCGS